ncbi:MAG TPA: ArsR family transcriptional regulator [Flavobacteriaceae bacterium]|nr:ArsR family transcriptional regulator [Legionellales bacterium]MAZ40186.1 ArsR family transcriptional regulator [Legionellales bacterium]HAT67202.1 ArsR family transcriptional regulator [Flavobacteriaceae bacterium]|tara:strand:- start:2937 stop:3266 length:330 start_codon:yes stop_codon:yes gene_type:complete
MEKKIVENCPIGATLKVLSGKWKLLILFSLEGGTKRFNELRREIPEITQRMLTTQLRELENDKIIIRKVYACVPPKVEYSLSPIGKTLLPVLENLKKWGACYIKKLMQK